MLHFTRDINVMLVISGKLSEWGIYFTNKNILNFSNSQSKFQELINLLFSRDVQGMELNTVETLVGNEGRELQRTLLEDHVKVRGVGDVGAFVIGKDGVLRGYKRITEKKVKTIFGVITVRRMGYYRPKFTTFFPLDAQLNLPNDSYSFSLQKLIALEAIKGSFDEAIETVERTIGIAVPKRQAEKIILHASGYFDSYYNDKKQKNNHEKGNPRLLILTLDGKGIPMIKGSLREATKKKANANKKRTTERLLPGEKRNFKRMAAVASVYNVGKFKRTITEVVDSLFSDGFTYEHKRPKPANKRVWASLKKSFEETVIEIFKEAEMKDPEKKCTWVALVDGDSKQIKYLEKYGKRYGLSLTIVCDFIHVLEYLWKASHVFFDEFNEKQFWVKERLERILNGKSSLVAAGIRRSSTRKKLLGNKKDIIDTCANYLLTLSPYLKYHVYINNGYPIATGIIEGACRYLVQDRMGKTGARWGLDGAEAILRLRSLKASAEFDDYWKYYLRQESINNYENAVEDLEGLMKKIEKQVVSK